MSFASQLLNTSLATADALSEGDRIEGGERRRLTLGLAGGVLLILVAHTVGNDGGTKSSASSRPAAPTGRREDDMRKSAKKTTASANTWDLVH